MALKVGELASRRDLVKFVSAAGVSMLSGESWVTRAGTKQQLAAFEVPTLLPQTTDELMVAKGIETYSVVHWGDKIGDKIRFGFNNDFNAWIRPSGFAANELLLWTNHEDIHELMVSGYGGEGPKSADQLSAEMSAVGGSLVRLKKSKDKWTIFYDETWNTRLDAFTSVPFSGGIQILGQKSDRGTLANCSGGQTSWETFLSCEENYQEFYGERQSEANAVLADPMQWRGNSVCPPEHYGWVVEYDPRTRRAQKLIGLGRFRHEGALVVGGRTERSVVYMGEDIEGGCIYKFVAGRSGSLEEGTLYVANTTSGEWIPLQREAHPALQKKFPDQLSVQINAAEAAKLVGGTPLDRPEGIALHPTSGAIFISLTNSAKKSNYFGSILKLEEETGSHQGTRFRSSTFLSGGVSTKFACPDNLCFDRRGNLWFTSDISEKDLNSGRMVPFGNNGLYYVPMSGKDAGKICQVASAPVDAELTGPCFLDDDETILVSVQHPGRRTRDLNKPTSKWNLNEKGIPRSAVVALTGQTISNLLKS